MPLQPKQEIKDPHSPANWKAVADVSTKHNVHGRCKTEHVARCEENFDELFRVPRIHEPKVNVHCAIHRSLVAREGALAPARMIKHFVQGVGASFAAIHREKNAAAENRIVEADFSYRSAHLQGDRWFDLSAIFFINPAHKIFRATRAA